MMNKRYNLYRGKVKEDQAVKMIQSVRHLKKNLGHLILVEKISCVGIRKMLKGKKYTGNSGYIKMDTSNRSSFFSQKYK